MPKQSLTKGTMVGIYKQNGVEMAAAMLLISRLAGVLANHRFESPLVHQFSDSVVPLRLFILISF
jgi:hypothetical protein